MRALGKYILLKEIVEQPKPGLVLTLEPAVSSYEVVSIGNDVKSIEIGDKVHFNRYSIHNIEIEGKDYICVKEEDIMAKE